jgi:selenocysteine-specific elongation factor
MVIAADEGVMPQTRGHMEICTLLGVQHGMVVLTKVDMVDDEWLELVMEDVREFVQGTFLEDAPILAVSSVNGQGIPELIVQLDELSQNVPERAASSIFRLPIDRVFTMKGFGTVITGTLVSGHVSVGESIMVYPMGITSKVRGIQVHNQSVNNAEAGMRTAINFQGLEKTAIQRGEVLSSPGALKSSYMVDVSLHFLSSNPKLIKNRTLVRFHTGTSEILGNLILLDREELSPGDTVVAQLRLNTPVALVKEDRFVIRSYSPIRTIGGGEVLNPIPKKHKRLNDASVEGLKRLNSQTPEQIVSYLVNESGYEGIGFSDLKIMTNVPEKQLERVLQDLMSKKTVLQSDKENRTYIHSEIVENLKTDMLNYLEHYHETFALKAGMPKEELKTKLPPNLASKLFNLILNQMIKAEQIVQEENTVRLVSHAISLGADQAAVRDKILNAYLNSGLQPPYFKELSKTLDIDPARSRDVLMHLVEEGHLVKTKEDLYFHAAAIEDLKKRLVEFLESGGEITTPQFKEMTGVSRKFVIPLAEYFDATNVTLRVGDVRKLRRG